DAAQGMDPVSLVAGAAQHVPQGTFGGGVDLIVLLTVLSLAPALLVMCTCFTRLVVVLGLLRQGLGTQALPPGQVMAGLALLLTFAVMAPTLERSWNAGIKPYMDGQITSPEEAWVRARQPLRDFMFAQIDATGNWSTVYMLMQHRGQDVSDPGRLTRADVDMTTLVPAFVLSELKTAFLIGFRILLPFVVIDLVVASVLVSLGMFMVPPSLVSLPFKLLLFVMADGWQLVVGSLLSGIAPV
ncbi:MAG: flagellar type III secretion system pore protein FliP, partial [Phycisphaerales bacterium]